MNGGRFTPGWKMTLFAALMLPVLLALGLWQLERADHKQVLENGYYDRVGMLPQAPPETFENAAFSRVRLTGRFEPGRHFLLDNQIHRGMAGYGVISSFLHTDRRRFLVNRGWLAAPGNRALLPDVPTPEGEIAVVGVLWPDLGLLPLLADDPWSDSWPKRIQRRNIPRMLEHLGNAAPLEVRLEHGQPGVFVPPRVDSVVSPAKHLGYAVQWFGLAGVLAVGYTIFGFRRHG